MHSNFAASGQSYLASGGARGEIFLAAGFFALDGATGGKGNKVQKVASRLKLEE